MSAWRASYQLAAQGSKGHFSSDEILTQKTQKMLGSIARSLRRFKQKSVDSEKRASVYKDVEWCI